MNNTKKGTCGCGRSPTGDCIGWHSLSEEMYNHQKMLWLEEQIRIDQELEDYKKSAHELWNDSCTTGRQND